MGGSRSGDDGRIPNVGKSSFINRFSGTKKTKVEDRPGVTRGKQWVTLDNGVDLLDMPGVLWPKFEDKTVGEHLAFTGAIKDDIMDTESLAARLAGLLDREYHDLFCARYKLAEGETDGKEPHDLLRLVGEKRGMKIAGGEIDMDRAAAMLLDEFRGGKIGRITLEKPNESYEFERAKRWRDIRHLRRGRGRKRGRSPGRFYGAAVFLSAGL